MSIVSNRDPRLMAHFLEKFYASHGDTVDDEYNFSSPNGRLIKKDHPDARGHAMGMLP